jgi:peptide-methionine (S)-S-oxide reductase
MFLSRRAPAMPAPNAALPGRPTPILTDGDHYIFNRPLLPPYPAGIETAYFALGCFWGAERKFWHLGQGIGGHGIWVTAVGYGGGFTPNANYDEVCSGKTGHTEVVAVAFDPKLISYDQLLATFWENHDPTQGHRQGNDTGTQYRSAIYTTTQAQQNAAEASAQMFGRELAKSGYGAITTEIKPAGPFYFAEEYHQQYLAKNPGGYCGLGGTGVSCPRPLSVIPPSVT